MAFLAPQFSPSPEWDEWQKKIALGNVFPPEARGFGMSRAGGVSQPIAPQDAVWNRDRGMPVFAQLAAMRQEQAMRSALAAQQMQAMQEQQGQQGWNQELQNRAQAIAGMTGANPEAVLAALQGGQAGNAQAWLQDVQAGRSRPEVAAYGQKMGVPPAETVPQQRQTFTNEFYNPTQGVAGVAARTIRQILQKGGRPQQTDWMTREKPYPGTRKPMPPWFKQALAAATPPSPTNVERAMDAVPRIAELMAKRKGFLGQYYERQRGTQAPQAQNQGEQIMVRLAQAAAQGNPQALFLWHMIRQGQVR